MKARVSGQFIIIIFLLVSACFADTKCTFSGVIGDETAAVIPGAKVALESAESVVEVETDSLGRFRIERVNDGKFVLRISSYGFDDAVLKWQCLSGALIDVDLRLIPAGIVTDGSPFWLDLPDNIVPSPDNIQVTVSHRQFISLPSGQRL